LNKQSITVYQVVYHIYHALFEHNHSMLTGILYFKNNSLIAALLEMLLWDWVMMTKHNQLAKLHDQL